jgi:anti-sigma B factor antagonist
VRDWRVGPVRSVLRAPLLLGAPVDELQAIFWQAVGSGDNHLVLNLGEVDRIDSTGIGLLVKALMLAKESGGSLKLVNPTTFVTRTLKMCALLPLFEVHQEEQGAVASYGS